MPYTARVFSLQRPRFARLLERLRGQPYSYPAVGCTQGTAVERGYFADRHALELGRGEPTFVRARTALERWATHWLPVLECHSDGKKLHSGQNVVLGVRLGPLWGICACRVIYVLEGPRHFGFAYGTLDPHPERGEKRFLIEWLEDDSVRFSLYAVSQPSHPLLWLVLPLMRLMQRFFLRGYLRSVHRAVRP